MMKKLLFEFMPSKESLLCEQSFTMDIGTLDLASIENLQTSFRPVMLFPGESDTSAFTNNSSADCLF